VVSYIRRAAGGAGSKKVAVCESFLCAAPVITTLQALGSGQPTMATSVTVPADGLPVIAIPPDIVSLSGTIACGNAQASTLGGFAKCRKADCSVFDIAGSLGVAVNPSVTTGSDGYPIASMWGCAAIAGSTQIKTIHCADLGCQSNFRPR